MFSEKDLAQIQLRGSNLAEVERQIENFRTGFPYLQIAKAAKIGDGIIKLNDEQLKQFVDLYDQKLSDKKVVKFVPASGAASRMFKALFATMNSYQGTDEGLEK